MEGCLVPNQKSETMGRGTGVQVKRRRDGFSKEVEEASEFHRRRILGVLVGS